MNHLYKNVLVLLMFSPLVTMAGEKENELIAKIVNAYGGNAITDLQNYRVEEHYLTAQIGQSNSPELTEVGKTRQVLHRDIANDKVAYDNWFEGRGGNNQNATVGAGDKAYTLNFGQGTYGDANNADPYAIAGGTMRTSDAILVYELNKVKDKATMGQDIRFMNRPHHTITMPFPLSPDLTLFVDADTYLISKMQRVNPQLGNLDYVFSDYQTDNGITYAASTVFSIAGNPNLISTQRELRFNTDIDDTIFAVPETLKQEGERIDASDMVVNKLSDRVFHIGQSGGFSLFADTNIGTVAVGGYPNLPDRLTRFQKESKLHKPLTHQIVTHHHSDHLGAINEAVDLGAKLVTVNANVDAIKDAANPRLGDHDFLVVRNRATLGDGRYRVEIYEVSTIHSDGFLVTYIPDTKTVFIADHYGSPFAKGLPVASANTVDMLKALQALDIDINKVATAHNARIFSMKEMRESVAAYKPTQCSGNRPVCK